MTQLVLFSFIFCYCKIGNIWWIYMIWKGLWVVNFRLQYYLRLLGFVLILRPWVWWFKRLLNLNFCKQIALFVGHLLKLLLLITITICVVMHKFYRSILGQIWHNFIWIFKSQRLLLFFDKFGRIRLNECLLLILEHFCWIGSYSAIRLSFYHVPCLLYLTCEVYLLTTFRLF